MSKIKVEVLRDGSYLQANMTAVPAVAGDVIEIKGGNYFTRCVELGTVKQYTPPTLPSDEDEGAVEQPEPMAPGANAAPGDKVEVESDADPVLSLMEIKGIGQKTAVQMVGLGVASKGALVAANAVDLSEELGTTVSKVQAWQAAARELLKGA